ncbi:unnamed protein product [Ixodes pacificus]
MDWDFMPAGKNVSSRYPTFFNLLSGESGFGLVAAITVTQLTDIDLFVLEGDLYLIVAQGHSTDSTGKTIVYRAATQGSVSSFSHVELMVSSSLLEQVGSNLSSHQVGEHW